MTKSFKDIAIERIEAYLEMRKNKISCSYREEIIEPLEAYVTDLINRIPEPDISTSSDDLVKMYADVLDVFKQSEYNNLDD